MSFLFWYFVKCVNAGFAKRNLINMRKVQHEPQGFYDHFFISSNSDFLPSSLCIMHLYIIHYTVYLLYYTAHILYIIVSNINKASVKELFLASPSQYI